MRSKEENWLPIVSKADQAGGDYSITHCETADCDQNADTGAEDCGFNTDKTRDYDHIVDCSDSGAIAEITFMPSFSKMYDKFAVAYYVVLRGALERFGLYPSGDNASEVGAPDIVVFQSITKLNGGTVSVDNSSSTVNGASIVIPADPYPLYPETFTCDGGQDALSPDPPDPADTYEAMWEDTVIKIGSLMFSPAMDNNTALGPAVYFGPYRNFFNCDATITIPYDTEDAAGELISPYVYNHLTKSWDELSADSYANGLLNFKTQCLGLFRAGRSSWVCAASAALGNNREKLDLLRMYRDRVLSKTQAGKSIIKQYYDLSPFLVSLMNDNAFIRMKVEFMIDTILPVIKSELNGCYLNKRIQSRS